MIQGAFKPSLRKALLGLGIALAVVTIGLFGPSLAGAVVNSLQCLLFGTNICSYYQALNRLQSIPRDPLRAEEAFAETLALCRRIEATPKRDKCFWMVITAFRGSVGQEPLQRTCDAITPENAPPYRDRRHCYALTSAPLLSIGIEYREALDQGVLSQSLRREFELNGISLGERILIVKERAGEQWRLDDLDHSASYLLHREGTGIFIYRFDPGPP